MAKEGKDTTEFQVVKQVDWLAKAAIVVGSLLVALPGIVEKFPIDSKAAIWGGIALAGLALVAKVLSALGYTTSRTRLKEADAAAKLPDPPADAG